MNILQMIRDGNYRKYQKAGKWNRMGAYMMRGAYVYDFGDGVALHSYTNEHWFLYIDGKLVSHTAWPAGLTDETINAAFAEAKQSKLNRINCV